MTRTDLLAKANDLRSRRMPFVFATVVRVERPASAKAGDCALVLPDGTIEGFVGGDCTESTVRRHGLRQLAAGQSMLLRITPAGRQPPRLDAEQRDVVRDDSPDGERDDSPDGERDDSPDGERDDSPDGERDDSPDGERDDSPDWAAERHQPERSGEGLVTACNPCLSGGTLEIFLEVMSPPLLVHVFGDSPIARALEALGVAMGWDMRRVSQPDSPVAPDTAAVIVASHGGDEEQILAPALRAGVPYVGLVASRRRGSAVVARLDVAPDQQARVHTPAGLDIAAHGPSEIAVSILAEIIASRPAAPALQTADRVPALKTTDRVPALQSVDRVPVLQSVDRVPAAQAAALDPVCGMSVAVANGTLRLEHAGTTWYFCGSGCRGAFAADPGRYSA